MPKKTRSKGDPEQDQVVAGGGEVGYADLLADAKARIAAAHLRTAQALTRELLTLYWVLGRRLVEEQQRHGWGSSVVERLAKDLSSSFPGIAGFSARNLWRMRAFFLAYPVVSATAVAETPATVVSATAVAETLPADVVDLPWGHQVVLIERVKDATTRRWYALAAREHGWSRSVLELQIESTAHLRWGKGQHNFDRALPSPQSDLARETLKDPYNFDFLTLAPDAQERALERGLIEHLQKFLLELGVGFAFVGQQHHLHVDGEDFYVDLLFYHLKLRCFVVLELKNHGFKPEFVGQLNFYASVVDDQLRHAQDQPTIGILLCKSKSGAVVEYALRDVAKPLGVSTFRVTQRLPEELSTNLPTVEQLEAALGADPGEIPE